MTWRISNFCIRYWTTLLTKELPLSDRSTKGQHWYGPKTCSTNAVAVVTPYAVSFTTLSRAIPKAIGKFAGYNKGLIIVRNVKVMTEEDHKNQATRMGTGGDGGGNTPFGPGAPPGTPTGAPPSAFPVPNRPNTLPGQGVPGSTTKAITVLDEKVLWVEIYLDIYRPIKKEEGPDPNAPAPAPAAPVAPAPTVN